MKKQVLAIIVFGFALLAMFQNCGPNPIAFNSGETGLTKVSLSSAPDGESTSTDDDQSVDDSDVDQSVDDSDDDADSAGLNYICILEGPGKSVAAGYSQGALDGQNSTPGVVCMSQSACKDLISKKFTVKGPEKRGYCPNKNKHVVPLSNEQIADLVK
ncbi:MAG: hypothetical protein SGJ18_15830 [Pseudomonadota bacterium]|nr:hypothetical protein [Pseudomonadota bacterium]